MVSERSRCSEESSVKTSSCTLKSRKRSRICDNISSVQNGHLSIARGRTRDSLCRDLTTDSWEDEEAVEDEDVCGNGSDE